MSSSYETFAISFLSRRGKGKRKMVWSCWFIFFFFCWDRSHSVIVASVGLWFGPVVKTVLLTQVLLLSRAKTVKDFSISCTVLAVRALGIHQVLGGDTSRRANNSWLKGYSMSYGIMLSMESWGEKEGGERGFMVMEFVFSSHCEAQWISGSPGGGWPHVHEMWWMSFFFCFASLLLCTASQLLIYFFLNFVWPIKLSLSQHLIFLSFTLWTVYLGFKKKKSLNTVKDGNNNINNYLFWTGFLYLYHTCVPCTKVQTQYNCTFHLVM